MSDIKQIKNTINANHRDIAMINGIINYLVEELVNLDMVYQMLR